MALNKATLGALFKAAAEKHRNTIENIAKDDDDIKQKVINSAEVYMQEMADAIIDHITAEAVIEAGIIVENGQGDQIGSTRESGSGQIK